MISRKRLAAAIAGLLNESHPIWLAEAFLVAYRNSPRAGWRDDDLCMAELEAMIVVWLRRERTEENKHRRRWGEPLLPKREPWTGKRTRKKRPRKFTPRKEGA